MLGMTAVICAIVTILAFRYGEKTGDNIDIASVILAVLAISVWSITDNPLYATVLATFADSICYVPTFRKLWKSPESEPIAYYILSTIKHGLAILSLSIYTLTTILFSSSVIFMNFIILVIVFYRSKK
jgi:K+-sensing histidine kinase KdpD